METTYEPQNTILYNGHEIKYQIIRSPRRKKSNVIIIKNEYVYVRACSFTPGIEIESFVFKKAKWILEKMNERKGRIKPFIILPTYKDGSTLPYMGKNLYLKIIPVKSDGYLKLENDSIFIAYTNKKSVKNLYEKWMFNRAQEIFDPIISKYSYILKVTPSKILVKKLKSRWGSATYKNTINLNVNLIKAPYDIIEYVILHELSHLIIRNHSKSFWRLVSTYMVDYKDKIKWLKINGSSLLR